MVLIPLSGLFHLEQNIPLAITIVVFASFLFASGATIQHLAVGGTVTEGADNPSMSVGQVLSLLRNPKWLLGLGTVVLGASIHIVGLALAPVTVVQPVGILAVPWSVLLAAKVHHFRPTRTIWGAVALTILGIAGFTYFSASRAAPDTRLPETQVIVAALMVFAIGATLGLIGRRGPAAARCLISAFGTLPLASLVSHPDFWMRPLFWVVICFLLVCYLGGGFMIQQGYANGPAEIVVGSMTTTDPIVAVTFGIIVLGEGVRLAAVDALGMVISGAVAIAGVVILSRFHPDAQTRRVPVARPEPAVEV